MKSSALLLESNQKLITDFGRLQEKRAEAYHDLEEGHRKYLMSGPVHDFQTFRQIVHDVTERFTDISQNIIKIEEQLRDASCLEAADIIAAIQGCEKQKLELTAHWQLAKQMTLESDGEIERETEHNIRHKLNKLVEEINDQLSEMNYLLHDQ